jgi:hypothetical protein
LYLFSLLAALKKFLKNIKALQCSFLWGGAIKEKKWALVAWEKLCGLKNRGGIGIREPRAINQALAAKIWRRWVKNPNALWEKLLKNKYALQTPQANLIRVHGDKVGSIIWNNAY